MKPSRQNERLHRAKQDPLAGALPGRPGSLAAMTISPARVPAKGAACRVRAKTITQYGGSDPRLPAVSTVV